MTRLAASTVLPASFRDPGGFVFRQEGILYRQVNRSCAASYDGLMHSGLYDKLVAASLLVRHEEVSIPTPHPTPAYKILQPDVVPFISYPYEWCFSQLKDAALALLSIQKLALEHGMSLKDCSAYNMQFLEGKPVLIDTLSFEEYREGSPWVAYRQFCQHFLAPLALMSLRDIRLNQLLRVYIDGVPLDLASSLLPFRSRLSFSLLSHVHLHARSQQRYAGATPGKRQFRMGKLAFQGIIDSLESAVRKLDWRPAGTEWADYYSETNYSDAALEAKKQLVSRFLDRIEPETVWDLGANTGEFSRLASDRGVPTVSMDVDPAAVEKNYRRCALRKETHLLPLLLDLTNPSPSIGWENRERMSLAERGPADTVMALALVHHLAISNNLPLDRIAGFFAGLCRWLIIEWVPKSDSQVQRLLATREDIFDRYTAGEFEQRFGEYFVITDRVAIAGSDRVLYLMRHS